MENGQITAVDIGEDAKPSMALAEDIQHDIIGTQVDDPIEILNEALDLQSNQGLKAVGHYQDNCVENLELNDQVQMLPSSTGNMTETDKANEDHEMRPSLSKLKANQKSDPRGVLNPSKKFGAGSPTAGVISVKKSTIEQGAALNGRPSQTLKGSVHSNPGALIGSNGGTGGFLEAGNAPEAPSSSSRLSLKHVHARKSLSNFTVPQPFALATDKRASLGGQLHSGRKLYTFSRSFNSQNIRDIEKKSVDGKEDDMKYPESGKREETKPQSKASANTFNFNSDVRAARRKEFNSKVEERLTAREAEKTQAQAKTKEDIQAEIRQFRKSLTFKAAPMPAFYQDANPPKLEIKKIPPTRARSPKLGRRNSTAGTSAKESPANQSTKENSQAKFSKPSSQAQDLKKPSQKTLKQEPAPNASSQKAVPNVLAIETSAFIDKTSDCGIENEVEGYIPKAPVLFVDHNGEESCVHPDNGETAGVELSLPAVSTHF